jgi:hypothetical protein
MSHLRLRRFSRPEVLRTIDADRLRELLAPYASELSRRGFNLPKNSGQQVNCLHLAELLADPSIALPDELSDALHLIDEMATADGLDRITAACQLRGRPLDTRFKLTPADAAVALWLNDRELLRRQHAEALLRRPRCYRSFQALVFPPPVVSPPTETQLMALARDLDDVFEARHRGRGTEVRRAHDGRILAFLIRHGGPYRREGRMDGRTVQYRPERYDVVRYHSQAGELQVNAGSEWERQLYRSAFGRLLFGNPVFFPGLCRFTLEPLRRAGEAALACADVPGIERIVLREVHQVVGMERERFEILRATDLFADDEFEIPAAARLTGANFAVTFHGARRARTVVIRPPNVAQYTRDADSTVVEEWLQRRGFMLEKKDHDRRSADSILDVA